MGGGGGWWGMKQGEEQSRWLPAETIQEKKRWQEVTSKKGKETYRGWGKKPVNFAEGQRKKGLRG